MSLQSVPLFSFDFLPSRPVEIEVSSAPLTSDAGLVPVRQFDERIRLTEQVAAALDDRRDPALTQQSLLSMVRQRVYGILADYEDQNDHDTLRSDPVFKLIADRLPDDPDLASQPTLSRFENAISIPDLWRLRDVLVDLFIQSFDAPPGHLTLDLDAFDDPAHGQQQLIMFHGYYEQYPYLPIVITCAENDMVLLVGLRHGTCHASLGADNDLRYLQNLVSARPSSRAASPQASSALRIQRRRTKPLCGGPISPSLMGIEWLGPMPRQPPGEGFGLTERSLARAC
jgi:Transposase DDE domain group 1